MAFSMFLRTTGCSSRMFTQQAMRLSNQPSFRRAVASTLPIRTLALNEAKSTPLMNAVRSFRTSIVRMSEEKPHDHSKLWVIEKAVAVILVPLIPVGLLMPNKITDSLIALLVCAHAFWGMEAMVVEYLRVLLFGPLVPKVAMGAVYGMTAVMLGGLMYLTFNDIGVCRGFWRIWRNMRKPKGSSSAPPNAKC